MQVYTLKRKEDNKEVHIFIGNMSSSHRCASEKKSICEKMDKSELHENVVACVSESEARKKSADIGRGVCGTCVSYLYATY